MELGDLLRGADAGDHVFALGIDQELAVELLLAGRWIAREGDARRRGLAHVAEHHGLHVDRGAPAFRNTVQAPIGDGALVHPGPEHGADRAPQLLMRVLRERRSVLLLEPLLVAADQIDPVIGREIGVERVAIPVLVVVEDLLEVIVTEAEHDVGIHRDEAAIGIVRETLVAGVLRQRLDRRVVEAEIEHGVHHPRHGRARPRAHRHQQRIVAVAEGLAGDAADLGERGADLFLQVLGVGVAVLVIVRADRGRDGEAGRHRQAEIGHLGKARALASEEVAHVGAAFGLAVAEAEDPFRFGGSFGRRLFGRSLRRRGRLAGRGLAGGSFADRFDTARRRFDHGIHGFGCARP